MQAQPRGLYLLNFVSMWEYFSYYGMRILLVLYMVMELQLSDSEAFIFYAIYTTLAELGGLIGGYVADRFLGLRRAVAIGGWTIAAGHVALAFSESIPVFISGLGLIVIGTALFRSNVAALLGTLYDECDSRREAGFTLYYTGINIGGFLATILCGLMAEMYGWHAGFGLAAIGMVAGNLALLFGKRILDSSCKMSQQKEGSAFMKNVKALLSQKVLVKRLAFCLLFLILFYAFEEQLGSTLVLFSERHVERITAWGTIPAASLTTFNPLTIILFGPILSRLLQRFSPGPLVMVGGGFALLGTAFSLLYAGCLSVSGGESVPLAYAIMSIVCIALGEIFIGPTIYSVASKGVPASLAGVTMGFVTVGFSLANMVSGFLSQAMAATTEDSTVAVYAGSFGGIGLIALALSVAIIGMNLTKKGKVIYENCN